MNRLWKLALSLCLVGCAPGLSPGQGEGLHSAATPLESNPVSLVYAHGVTSGCSSCISWRGFVTVGNLAYEKDVTVVYAIDDGPWRESPARFVESLPGGRELWRFEGVGSPGRLRFALRYRVAGQEFWDNAGGADYHGNINNADGLGLVTVDAPLGTGREVVVTGAQVTLPSGNEVNPVLRVYLRVRNRAYEKRVRVVYSVDGWTHVAEADAHYVYGGDAQQWRAEIPLDPAAQNVAFAVSAQMAGIEAWDNNFGRDLHCTTDSTGHWTCPGGALLR